MLNFNALSLFSSAGVAETFFENHGIHVRVASELLKERATLYRHLYPDVNMIQGDITDKKNYSQIIRSAKGSKCDFIIATPPCQGMSTAGLQKKNDPRNRLILYVIDAIKKINPKFAIIENVPEILSTSIEINGEWVNIDELLKKELSGKYHFNEKKVVNAMNYGVAQSRERCVYLLSRKDTKVIWEFPEPCDRIATMRDAIGDLPSLDPEVTDITETELLKMFPDYYSKKKAGAAISRWHFPPKHKLRHVIAMMHTPEGNTAWNNNIFYPTLKDGSKSKGYKNTYKRQWWDKPAYTITKYTSRIGSQENGHPGTCLVPSDDETKRIWSDARTMTIFELMRLTSLPDDWNIPDNTSTNLLREIMGEGVPPRLLEKAIIELDKLCNGK